MGLVRSLCKGGRVRTVAIPLWVKHGINTWMIAAKSRTATCCGRYQSGKLISDELGGWAAHA